MIWQGRLGTRFEDFLLQRRAQLGDLERKRKSEDCMNQYETTGVHFIILVQKTAALLLVISLLGFPFSGCEHWLVNYV